MYKLIAIDIDDTLLNEHNQVTEKTKQALKAAQDAGVTITLATGRMFASAQQIAKQIELNVPIITYQGSLVKTLVDEKVLYQRDVPKEAALQLLEYAKEHQLHLQLYVNDTLYGIEDNERIKAYSRNSNIPYKIEADFNRLINEPNHKMLIIDEPEILDSHIPILQEKLGHVLHITKSKPNFLEFMHKEGTKGEALKHLAQYFNCDLSETIAIGDAWNDREMIQVAGLGIAMGNAVEPLKALADYITLSHNEDGVAYAINKFIFNQH